MIKNAHVVVWTITTNGYCHGIPKYDRNNVYFLDNLEAKVVSTCLTYFWCRKVVLIRGTGFRKDKFEVNHIVFPNDILFADGLGALYYSDPHQKLVASCHWCNM